MNVNWLRVIVCFAAVAASAAEPLHVRIDKLVEGQKIRTPNGFEPVDVN